MQGAGSWQLGAGKQGKVQGRRAAVNMQHRIPRLAYLAYTYSRLGLPIEVGTCPAWHRGSEWYGDLAIWGVWKVTAKREAGGEH